MRKVSILLGLVAVVALVASGVALAAVINGTAGDDTLTGTLKADSISGHGGNDKINARAGVDEAWGGTGSDVIQGEGHNDTLHGEGGNDTLRGGAEDDELRGDDGVDALVGNDGNDRLYDRGGDAAERDTFTCGAGEDTVFADATDFVNGTCEIRNPDNGTDLLPDLAMAPIGNIQIQPGGQVAGETTTAQDTLLRFSTTIVNVGDGHFEITGRRPNSTTTDMTTTQRIYDSAGGFRDRSTDASFFYSGDGHNHWHVRDLEDYELFRTDGSVAAREGQKMGFCFYDNVEYGAQPGTERYGPGCSNGQPNLLAVTMGLQRGWGDLYFHNTNGQYINITGLPDGDYRLLVDADRSNRFLEKNESNNSTYADLRIAGNTVQVLAYGPSPPPIG